MDLKVEPKEEECLLDITEPKVSEEECSFDKTDSEFVLSPHPDEQIAIKSEEKCSLDITVSEIALSPHPDEQIAIKSKEDCFLDISVSEIALSPHPDEQIAIKSKEDCFLDISVSEIALSPRPDEQIEMKSEEECSLDITESKIAPSAHLAQEIERNSTDFRCSSCSESFNCEYLLKVHAMLHDPNQYCIICKRTFRNHFENHLISQHFNQCPTCLKTFTMPAGFKAHLRTHQKKRSLPSEKDESPALELKIVVPPSSNYQCSSCSETFSSQSLLKVHAMIHDPRQYCFVCKKTYPTGDFKEHVIGEHFNQCIFNECKKTFVKKKNLKDHIKRIHGEKKLTSFKCDLCDRVFQRKKNLAKHVKYHNVMKPVSIQEEKIDVKTESTTEDSLDLINSKATQSSTQTDETIETKSEKFECSSCEQTFNCEYLLNVHAMLHDPTKYCFICKRTLIGDFKGHVMNIHFNQCDQCMKTFTFRMHFKQHMTIHNKFKRYVCDICRSSFEEKDNLLEHFRSAHPDAKTFSCKLCEKTIFTSISHLNRHTNKCHVLKKIPGEYTYKCDICSNAFPTYEAQKNHEEEHDLTKTCQKCNETYDTITNLRKHYTQVHVSSTMFSCHICWRTFTTRGCLNQHVNCQEEKIDVKIEHTTEDKPDLIDPKEVISLRQCDLCLKTFSKKSNLKAHLKILHNAKLIEEPIYFNCHLCESKFKKKRNLSAHIKSIHEGIRPFSCKQCNSSFFSSAGLYSHRQIVHDPEKYYCYKCNICSNMLSTYKMQKAHEEEHNLTKTCKECNETYDTITNLRKHFTQVHAPSYLLSCKVCWRTFKTSHYLKRHIDIGHVKKFRCRMCNITFFGSEQFKATQARITPCSQRQRRIYKSKFSCTFCLKPCSTLAEKEEHKAKHAETRVCDFCHKKFLTLTILQKHVQTLHTPVQCPHCHKLFARNYLEKHLLLGHNKKHTALSKGVKCELCGKMIKHRIREHMRYHKEGTFSLEPTVL